jgi:tetratricopeptide (TPR) repeat protein
MTAPPLRPLSPLGIIDTATRLCRRNLRAYLRELLPLILTIGLAFLVIAGQSGMLLVGQWYWPFGLTHLARLIYASGGAPPADLRTAAQELAAFWVLQSLGTALLLRPVVTSYIGPVAWGRQTGPDTTARLALALLALLPLGLLSSVVAVALTLANTWLDLLSGSGPRPELGPLLLGTLRPLLALAAAVAALARLAVAPQIVLLEGLPLKAALRRSWRLTGGFSLRVLATLLLLALLTGLLVGLPLLLSSMSHWLPNDALADRLPWLGLLLSQVVQTLLLPLPVVALTVLYIDLRVRAEGFDLAVAAGRAGQAPPAAVPASRLRIWWDRYWERYRANDLEGALRALDEALQHFPREHNLLRQRIAVRIWRNDLLGALADAERLVAAYPTYLDALVDRATVRHHLGDRDGALIDLNRVLAQQPDQSAALHLRSHLRYLRADYAGARADLLRILQTAPDDHTALYNLACCCAREQQPDQALEHLARAVALSEQWRSGAATDEDFAPLRADPRFVALTSRTRPSEEISPHEQPQ